MDWGFLNLVLGLVVAFFEESWAATGDDVDVEAVFRCVKSCRCSFSCGVLH